MSIDPITLARFMVLPGADELVAAFSAIPPGPLRDSVISHAKVMAQTYDDARLAGAPIPDPLQNVAPRTVLAAPPAAQALPAPKVKVQSPEAQAVRLRLQGKSPGEIADELEVDLATVTGALAQARKAGVKFKALPKVVKPPGGKTWVTRIEDLSGQGRQAAEQAARGLRLSLENYMEKRRRLVELRTENVAMGKIAKELRLSEDVLWRWVYAARASGIPLSTKFETVGAIEAEYEPVRRFFPPWEALTGVERAACERAALKRGIAPEVYHERRERILCMRMEGVRPAAIERELGESVTAVKDIIAHAAHRWGLTLPPLEGPRQ